MEERPRMRTHGFERPFHPLQILSWVVFGSDVIFFILFCLPIVGTVAAKAAVASCFAASVLVLVLATVVATSCDPADPHVRLQDDSELQGEDCDSMPYCSMCNVPVFARSKHCRACNKCVNVFDHHCMWLNNCIGGANYRAFLVAISSVAVMIGIVLATCLYLLVDYSTNLGAFEDRVLALNGFQTIPKEFFLGLLITMLAVNVPLFVLDMQLVVLHAFLMSQQLTTYEYIMSKREQADRRQAEEGTSQASLHVKRVRTLPRCLDWIVFSRCGQRSRKKSTNKIERIETTVADGAASVGDEVGTPESATKSARGRPVGSSPSPPGSTTELEDSCEMAHRTSPQAVVDMRMHHDTATVSVKVDGDVVAPVCGNPWARPLGSGPSADIMVTQDNQSDQKVLETSESPSHPTDSPGATVAAKLGCGCDGARACDQRQPAPAPAKL